MRLEMCTACTLYRATHTRLWRGKQQSITEKGSRLAAREKVKRVKTCQGGLKELKELKDLKGLTDLTL